MEHQFLFVNFTKIWQWFQYFVEDKEKIFSNFARVKSKN